MANTKHTAFQVEISVPMRTKLALSAQSAGKSSSEFAREALSKALDAVDDERLESRLATLEKTAQKSSKRIEDLFALVRSVEDDEIERRRKERKSFTDAMSENYTMVAEAVAANSAVVESLAGELRANREATEKLGNRLDGQALMIVALVHGAPDKGVRKSYLDIYTTVTKGEKKVTDFQRDAMSRGV